MNVREIKVKEFIASQRKGRTHRSKPTVKPQLVLTGLWLHEAGFFCGQHVKVQVCKDRLIIHS